MRFLLEFLYYAFASLVVVRTSQNIARPGSAGGGQGTINMFLITLIHLVNFVRVTVLKPVLALGDNQNA
jgi:hypothetical protein